MNKERPVSLPLVNISRQERTGEPELPAAFPAQALLTSIEMKPGDLHLVRSEAGALVHDKKGKPVTQPLPDGTVVYYGAFRDILRIARPNAPETEVDVSPSSKLTVSLPRTEGVEGGIQRLNS